MGAESADNRVLHRCRKQESADNRVLHRAGSKNQLTIASCIVQEARIN
ncbi:hypothetical protein MCS25_07680 [Porphyromonas gingivalis]|nr:hypothetical protein [Porphyromonas gingivalis]USI93600.1 hypothetical protein MCS24_07670 [Porphyromonas gingivalis]USI95487.1 hypothetical protein MCS27_07685 [Porphyromonas gingivalis]USI97393.1 hypothetical protein MCS25_07680 [Porphyromonas gingivalis]